MITHYLKVAFRNLLKYKTHSIISVLCLAVGITCFSLMNYFIDGLDNQTRLPDYEHRIQLSLISDKTAANPFFRIHEIQHLEELSLIGMDTIVAYSFTEKAEITAIDKNQKEFPFLIKYQCVSSNFFSYTDMKLMYGNQIPQAPDDVIISEHFARKVFGEENPIGMSIHLTTPSHYSAPIESFKIVNVVADKKYQGSKETDCYFTPSMNPRFLFKAETYLTGKTTLENLNKQLEQISWKRGEETVQTRAYFQAERNNSKSMFIGKLIARFIASLILLSGLINFLKFIIQMFYNRQRELAIRKCVGSDIKGIFALLFAEIFWMMSIAFLLSLVLTEVVTAIAYVYVPQEVMTHFPTTAEIYSSQFFIYIGLLFLCLFVICYPIYRLHRVSIISYVVQRQSRHIFRSIMIGLQLAISIFFVGSVWIMTLSFNEMFGKQYNPLSPEEEKQIISLSVNSLRMQQNMDAILSDISSLSGVTDRISISNLFDLGVFTYMSYEKNDQPMGQVTIIQGDPHYFDFFRIPMEGKKVEKNATNTVYVSEEFKKQLQKDSIEGTVQLSGDYYQIAGTYKALNKEGGGISKSTGSVFLVNPATSIFYFRVADSEDPAEMIKKITDICRHYVPDTLPLDIRSASDNKQTMMGTVDMMRNASMLLAIISLLLVVLSIYSAISMDAINRQKEVAIRKINGATPRIIALLFGKAYLILYLSAFIVIYPLLRIMWINISRGEITCAYRWDWGIMLFFSMAFLIFMVMAYKIYQVMHINPANIIKKE